MWEGNYVFAVEDLPVHPLNLAEHFPGPALNSAENVTTPLNSAVILTGPCIFNMINIQFIFTTGLQQGICR